ncbi:hypothetical protein DEM27_05670 [Metarhizobium album]|uniref:Uncharacterized protein n=1 Tax=Metarhizobium album TaxID=2182425 RepID=A0A2U2DV00_9HYPH|nr:hypothetical protein [Rhizobium album]PWE57130.1 hypothetical protein DEM27_05670 [Rhizobium album]
MPTIAEIRQQYPQYSDMSDDALASALHQKFYSDMPLAVFRSRIGVSKMAPGKHLSYEEGADLVDAEERAKTAAGQTTAGLTGIVDGVPIAGPYLLGGVQRGAAALSSLIDGESYDRNLNQAKALTDAAQAENPWTTTAGNVAGAVGGTIPMVMAAPAAFGGGSAGIMARSIYSMLTGGGIGAADSAVRSNGDVDDTLWGAGSGAAMGLVGPTAGKLIGAGANKLLEFFRDGKTAKAAGTTRYALNKLRESFGADDLDVPTARNKLADLGPEGMIADLGDNVRGRAEALANMPGEGNSTIRNSLEARRAGANDRIRALVDQNLGRNVVPSQVIEGIEANQQAITPRYAEVFRNARNYDISPVADDLDLSINRLRGDAQRRLRQVRGMLNTEGTDQLSSNPRVFFETRQAIDGMLATEADPKVIRELAEARQMIDDALDRAVPQLKEVDAQYAELARQKDAIGRGQQVLDSGRTSPRPTELAAEIDAGVQPNGLLVGPSAVPLRLSQGARAEIDRILGTNANDVQRLNRLIKTQGDWNRDRLAMLFGPDKADDLFRVLDNELTFSRTRDKIIGNSATAGRQQQIADLGGATDRNLIRDAYAAGGTPGAVRGAGLKAADRFLNMILKGRVEKQNKSLADLVTSNRAAVVDAMLPQGMSADRQKLIEQMAKSILLGGGMAGSR